MFNEKSFHFYRLGFPIWKDETHGALVSDFGLGRDEEFKLFPMMRDMWDNMKLMPAFISTPVAYAQGSIDENEIALGLEKNLVFYETCSLFDTSVLVVMRKNLSSSAVGTDIILLVDEGGTIILDDIKFVFIKHILKNPIIRLGELAKACWAEALEDDIVWEKLKALSIVNDNKPIEIVYEVLFAEAINELVASECLSLEKGK